MPTPLPVGKVNLWLLEGEPLTLVDAGPRDDASFAALETTLGERGLGVEDVELLILTHQHVDHVGNAAAIVERSGCRVAAHELLAGFVGDMQRLRDLEAEYQDAVLALHGTAEGRRQAFWEAIASRRALWHGPVTVDLTLAEGETLRAGGRTLRASLRPGHSPTDTVYLDDEGGVALVADHLLPHISSNPLACRPLVGSVDPRDRVSALRAYLDSLARTAVDDLGTLLPGHARPFTGHRELIARRVAMHEARVEQVADVLSEGTLSAREIADLMWSDIAITQTFLTLCEVLGALDLLEERRLVRRQDDGIVRWERV